MKYTFREKLAVTVLSAIMIALPNIIFAVEDGLNTNVMNNIRIQTTGVIDLSGIAITNWSQVGSTADVASLRGATNALNTRVNVDLAGATNNLYNATNVLNTRVNVDLAGATNNLYNATNVLNTRVNVDLAGATNNLYNATNVLNSSVNELKLRTNNWNMAIYTPGSQQIDNNDTTVSVANAVARIGGGAVVTFANCVQQIAIGTSGQFLTVICTNASDVPIKFSHGKGVKLSETISFSMSTNDVIQFIYDGTSASWIEVHRADN